MSTSPNTTLAQSVLDQISNIQMSDRVRGLREAYFRAVPEVCTERAKLITEKSKAWKLFEKRDKDKPSITSREKAKLYQEVLAERNTIIWHTEARELKRVKDADGERNQMVPFTITEHSLFAGSTTSHFKGVPLYPEFIATWIWPELELIQQREKNPYYLFGSDGNPLSEEQKKLLKLKGKDLRAKKEHQLKHTDITLLNRKVFPYWINNNITELGRARARAEVRSKGDTIEFELLQNLVFYLTTKPNCISHTIPSFRVAIDKGLKEIIKQAEEKQGGSGLTDEQKDFYKAIATSMEGVVQFSNRLADEARNLAAQTEDPVEKQELEELAKIHTRIPAEPAQDFR